VKDSKPQGHPRSAFTPANLEGVRDTISKILHRLVRWQDLALCLKDSNVLQMPHKDLHYNPYKIHVAQELSEKDNVS
jgi:hypothetical protein